MNFISLPVFILFFAIVYLSIVYALLKLAEAHKGENTMISQSGVDTKQGVNTP